MNYGLSYKGSKSRIAKWVVEALPSADVWVEPFAGGCLLNSAMKNFMAGRNGKRIAIYRNIGCPKILKGLTI